MAILQLAQVGCGGMGLRHVYGLIELRQCGFSDFQLVSICDKNRSAAEYVAKIAEAGLGLRPRIHTDFQQMLETEVSLDAVNIVTDTLTHQPFAVAGFNAGLHVSVEKPMAITVSACHKMLKASIEAGKVLSVSENYRRDPMNRFVKMILESGIIGDVRLAINVSTTTGTNDVRQVVAWRHLKDRGGLILEYGVHTSDLILYFMGSVDRIYAETHLWQKTRTMTDHISPELNKFYSHRVKEEIENVSYINATAEDTAASVLRFKSGAIGQITYSDSAPGESSDTDVIYGSKGSLRLPGSRTGNSIKVFLTGNETAVSNHDLLKEVPEFHLDDVTSHIFGGADQPLGYQLSFEDYDRKLIAIEMQDFCNSIIEGREPEVMGSIGLDAVALSYSIVESGYINEPVLFEDVRNGSISGYQRGINLNSILSI